MAGISHYDEKTFTCVFQGYVVSISVPRSSRNGLVGVEITTGGFSPHVVASGGFYKANIAELIASSELHQRISHRDISIIANHADTRRELWGTHVTITFKPTDSQMRFAMSVPKKYIMGEF